MYSAYHLLRGCHEDEDRKLNRSPPRDRTPESDVPLVSNMVAKSDPLVFPIPPSLLLPPPPFPYPPSVFPFSPSVNELKSVLNRVGSPRRPRSEKRPIPEEQKDEKYYERRKRNNQAAKKSRDARRLREDQIALRASVLEHENAVLRAQVLTLREEAHSLRQILVVQSKSGNLPGLDPTPLLSSLNNNNHLKSSSNLTDGVVDMRHPSSERRALPSSRSLSPKS